MSATGTAELTITPDVGFEGLTSFFFSVADTTGCRSNDAEIIVCVSPTCPKARSVNSPCSPNGVPIAIDLASYVTPGSANIVWSTLTLDTTFIGGATASSSGPVVTISPIGVWSGSGWIFWSVSDENGCTTATQAILFCVDPDFTPEPECPVASNTSLDCNPVVQEVDLAALVVAPTPVDWSTLDIVQPSDAAVAQVGNSSVVTIAPNPGWCGSGVFTWTVENEDCESNSASVLFCVECDVDLVVSKTDSVGTFTDGDTLTYSISYVNNGASDASGVYLSEAVPFGVTAGSNPGWVGSGANWQFPIGDLAAGASGVATFTVIADSPVPSGVTSITNVVSVDSDQAAGNTATDTDIYVAPECPTGVDLSAPCVPHGQQVIVNLADAFPGVTMDWSTLFVSQPANATVTNSPSPGAVLVAPDSGWSGTQDFTLSVEHGNGCESNLVTVTFCVDPPVDVNLTISKSDGVTEFVAGQTLVYEIEYANSGSQPATNVVITETIPFATTAGSNPAWSPVGLSGSVWTLNIGTVPAGGSGSVSFTGVVDDPVPPGVAAITNVVSLNSDQTTGTIPNDTDINDLADDVCPVAVDVSPECVSLGQTITIEMSDFVTQGTHPIDWGNAFIEQPGNANVSFSPSQEDLLVITPNSGWTGTDSFTFSVPDTEGCDSNLVTIEFCVDSPGTSVDLAITMTADVDFFEIEDIVRWEMTVTNNGTGVATNVRITDVLPQGWEPTGIAQSLGWNASSSLTGAWEWIIGSMNPGQSIVVSMQSTSNDLYPGDPFAVNSASVSSNEELAATLGDNTTSHQIAYCTPCVWVFDDPAPIGTFTGGDPGVVALSDAGVIPSNFWDARVTGSQVSSSANLWDGSNSSAATWSTPTTSGLATYQTIGHFELASTAALGTAYSIVLCGATRQFNRAIGSSTGEEVNGPTAEQ